jgi:hypothetical protein
MAPETIHAAFVYVFFTLVGFALSLVFLVRIVWNLESRINLLEKRTFALEPEEPEEDEGPQPAEGGLALPLRKPQVINIHVTHENRP